MMTLNEAIERCFERGWNEECRKESGVEHLQLAFWLSELKYRRKIMGSPEEGELFINTINNITPEMIETSNKQHTEFATILTEWQKRATKS